ncbi:MAG: hypothetical protein EOP74_00195 [Variovorax sp.]|nr:MAG: hypothetical protein EOP74_00195 [Variovorax sp.]
MKRLNKHGKVEDTEPFDNDPDDFLHFIHDRWLPSMSDHAGGQVLDYRLIEYLEYEAVNALSDRFPELPSRPILDQKRPDGLRPQEAEMRGFASRAAPLGKDTYQAARERWRHLWVVEAHHHERTSHAYPKKLEAALNILLATSRLRQAIEANQSQRSAALGMVLAFEAIRGGYGRALEAESEAHQILLANRNKAHQRGIGKILPDLARAKQICIELAAQRWRDDPSERIGEVVDNCFDDLFKRRAQFSTLSDIPTPATIKGWLKAAAAGAKPTLKIPPEAQRPGANKRPSQKGGGAA